MVGLRALTASDAERFEKWEKAERPYPWTKQHFVHVLKNPFSHAFVWDSEHGILGFVVVQLIQDEAYLLNIMISPSFRCSGYGLRLLEKLFVWAKKAESQCVFLDVDPSNVHAYKLYLKAGFKMVERRPKAYPRGEDSFLMKKEL